MNGYGLHGCYTGENREDLVVSSGGDGGVEEEFVHFCETMERDGKGIRRRDKKY